jgi:SAM-dependent methyltransferase
LTTLAEIQESWEKSHRYGDLPARLERAKRWLPYYAFLADGAAAGGDLSYLIRNEFVDRLAAEKKLRPEDRVLDIGAGTGNYTIPIAAKAAEVTALDVSPESLQVLSARAKALGFSNIRTVLNPWETFQTDELFDVTFSSMCTAICNTEELMRMEAMTKRCCGIVTVMPGSRDSHRKAILNGLDVHPDGMIGDAITFYQVLYYLNRYPEVACRTVSYKSEITREKFFAQYCSYLPIFGIPEETYMPYLTEYWANHAVNKLLTETSELHLAMITWNVP